MIYRWETKKERFLKGLKISPAQKLEGLRLINELADKVMTKRQKVLRRKFRESC